MITWKKNSTSCAENCIRKSENREAKAKNLKSNISNVSAFPMAKMQGARHAVCPSCLVPCGWKGPAFPVANWKHIWPRAHSHTPSGGSSISAARHLTSSRPGEICEFLGPPWKPPRTPPRKTPRETPRESTRDTARVHGRLRTGNRLPPPKKPYVFNLVFELYINFSELYIKWSRTIYKFLRTIYKISGKFRDFRRGIARDPGARSASGKTRHWTLPGWLIPPKKTIQNI